MNTGTHTHTYLAKTVQYFDSNFSDSLMVFPMGVVLYRFMYVGNIGLQIF